MKKTGLTGRRKRTGGSFLIPENGEGRDGGGMTRGSNGGTEDRAEIIL